ncbi:MAG: 50S ribosomal protein L18 [Lentisphaeria bacterium]|nr:50S ribosomal protein L18 [Lentisphaeria bacterium]
MAKRNRKEQRARRHFRIRKKISGTSATPRMSVYTSEKHIYVQFIDDVNGVTLASASTVSSESKEQGIKANLDGAAFLGKLAAEKAKAAGIESVVFDRGGFAYHGRVKAIADNAREAGLQL